MAYRGKYPDRIREIWSNYRNPNIPKGRYCRTNCNKVYIITANEAVKLGQEIATVTSAIERQ